MVRVLRLLLRGMSWIPYPVGQLLGGMLGTAASFLPVPRLRVALENMRACLGAERSEADLRRLYRRMFRHFGRMFFEVPHILRITPDNVERYAILENEKHFFRALAQGKGVIVLTAHFGNWELMSAVVSLRCGGGSIVVRPLDFPPADRILEELRSRFNSEIIPKQKGARRILAALRKGRAVGILLDQNVDWYEGIFVDFLGRTACTNKGLALIALKTGVPVVPTLTIRRPQGGYRVVFLPPVEPQRTGDPQRDVEDTTARYAAVLSRVIQAHPDHWFWFHRRWKTRNFCPLPAPPHGGTE
jgi:Kdo2-lipid IVA lauroyltransferase/acyltransferase